MSKFLEMSRVVREELIAGRISCAEAKARLKINVEIAEHEEIVSKLRALKSRRIGAWDTPREKMQAIHQFQDTIH